MKFERQVRPSDQVDIIIPEWIREQYPRFVEFMTQAFAAEERQGFAADILQNMLKYRDFDYYKGEVIFRNSLSGNIDEYNDESLELNDTEGFPKTNGVVRVDNELILYRKIEGNKLVGLQRGSSGTIYLGTFVRDSDYVYSIPQSHKRGTPVYNLSALFLRSFLKTIHETFVTGIDPDWIDDGINRGTLLERIKDFFQSKGTKLGIQSLFKMLFGENDVEVNYPGDRMIVPSKSTYNETNILRTVPIPEILVNLNSYIPPERLVQTGTAIISERGDTVYDDRTEIVIRSLNAPYEVAIISPEKLINKEIVLKSYNDLEDTETEGRIYGRAITDYVTSYQHGDETQYELYVQKKTVEGNFVSNPSTILTRDVKDQFDDDTRWDYKTITVDSTIGFPEKGIIFIENEGIKYDGITFNQFLNCKRGHIGVEAKHKAGFDVRGPFFLEGTYDVQDKRGRIFTYTSRSWPLGLVEKVNILDPGILHETTDQVTAGEPGNVDPREPMLAAWDENYDDLLVTEADLATMQDVEYLTAGISGVYFDSEYVFTTSSNFPTYMIGQFSDDGSVGGIINTPNALHVFPRYTNIKENKNGDNLKIFTHKGFGPIGLCVNGAPFYSNVSNQRILSGKIQRYNIVHTGYGYIDPTILVDDVPVDEIITIEPVLGRITNITTRDNTIYTGITTPPKVEITGGRGAELKPKLDEYGRVLEVEVINGGEYYTSEPTLTMYDKSKQGKGASMIAKIADGAITEVEVVNQGIDYNRSPDVVSIVVTPRGQDCQVVPIVQYYQVNRPGEIAYHKDWFYDIGGGFLWEFKQPTFNFDRATTAVEKINYGYVTHPFTGIGFDYKTPQLLGYAYDGLPIYSPVVYQNGQDDSKGYKYIFSGYVERGNRESIVPGGGGPPTAPPTEQDYPMGTFVEDFVYSPEEVLLYIEQIDPDLIEGLPDTLPFNENSNPGLPFNAFDGIKVGVCNENNAFKMNTPEYPVELYPDGVWCYIATIDAYTGKPAFPYIIGETFEKRPLSQRVDQNVRELPQAIPFIIYNPNSNNLEAPIRFDYDLLERYRNAYLPDTNDELKLEIEQTSRGFVSGVHVVDGLPFNSKVGDYVYFDNENSGGSGASARVSEIGGVDITKAYNERIDTVFQTHFQKLNIGTNVYDEILHGNDPLLEPGEKWKYFHFIEGQVITTSSGAEATVVYWDWERSFLYVDTITKNLIIPGDAFKDIKNRWVKLTTGSNLAPTRSVAIANNNPNNINRQNRISFENIDPVGATPGDLWYSTTTGRLYVYFRDDTSGQWVGAQPIAMRTFTGALDEGTGTTEAVEENAYINQSDTRVIISPTNPQTRKDGGPLITGDMWWSPHTGFMYIYVQGQWATTDPTAVVPTPDADDNPIDWPETNLEDSYEGQQYVMISLEAPTGTGELQDGPLWPGLLWWSPRNGKMFIYTEYAVGDGTFAGQWVQTNPVGRSSSDWGLDEPIDGGGGGDSSEPPAKPLPLPDGDGDDIINQYYSGDEIVIWFDHLRDFQPGDKLAFAAGGSEYEVMTIESILVTGAPAAARMRRGVERKTIQDRSQVWNFEKYRYIIETEYPHRVRMEDTITLVGSQYEALNVNHHLADVGVVKTATATTTVLDGEVVSATVTDGGEGYTADFEVFFYGGNGNQGQGVAVVNPTDGGYVESIRITNPGYSYTTAPEVWFGATLQDNQMMFYTDVEYNDVFTPENAGTGLSYKTDSTVLTGPVATVDMIYGGQGYIRMPKIMGIYHKAIDRGDFKVLMDNVSGYDGEGLPIYSQGTSITEVEILLKGSRYNNPKVLFIDLAGNGYGASGKAVIVDGRVEEIQVIDGGYDYQEPIVLLVEDSGKYIGLTETIGQIKDISIINPGRSLSTNETINPEIQIDTRVILEFDLYIRGSLLSADGYNPTTLIGVNGNNGAIIDPNRPVNDFDNFKKGDLVWQGDSKGQHKVCTATVIDYDTERQIITLRNVSGKLKEGEYLYGEVGAHFHQSKGLVIREGQADVRTDVRGMSRPKGRFIDDTSMPSSKWANIQDSFYFQHFSYSISSPLQQRQFDDFVSRIIHPAGMIMFSDVTVRSNVQNDLMVFEPIISGPVVPILSPDAYEPDYWAFNPQGEWANNPAIGPNMGTLELTDGAPLPTTRRERIMKQLNLKESPFKQSKKAITGKEKKYIDTSNTNAPIQGEG